MITMKDIRDQQVADIAALARYIENNFEETPKGLTACECAIKIMTDQAHQIAALRILVLELEDRKATYGSGPVVICDGS